MKKVLGVLFSVVLVLGLAVPSTLYAQTPSDDSAQSSDVTTSDKDGVATLSNDDFSITITDVDGDYDGDWSITAGNDSDSDLFKEASTSKAFEKLKGNPDESFLFNVALQDGDGKDISDTFSGAITAKIEYNADAYTVIALNSDGEWAEVKDTTATNDDDGKQDTLTFTSKDSSDFMVVAADDEEATEQDGEEGSDATDDKADDEATEDDSNDKSAENEADDEATEDESDDEATEDDSETDADEDDSEAADDESGISTLAATTDDSDIQTLDERTEYPDAGIPDIDDLEWGMNLSKSATNLNEDYESTVTLNVQHDIDLVIVQDGTNLENATFSFLESLEEQTEVHVNAGLVVFGGTTPISYTTGELLDLSDPKNMDTFDKALNDTAWDDLAGHSGSNVQAGIHEARNLLNSDTTHPTADKFMVVVSDCAARMWIEGDDLDTAYAQSRYIPATKALYFDTNMDWEYRYGQWMYQSRNMLGDESEYLFNYPTFQDVWNAGEGGADIDNYVMSYPEWQAKEAADGDEHLSGSISVVNQNNGEPNVVTTEDYYSNYETATYHTAKEFINAASGENIHLISLAYYGYTSSMDNLGFNRTYGKYMDTFQEWLGELNNVTRHHYSILTNPSSAIFNQIMEDIKATEVGSGDLIDEMGSTDDYDFDFIDAADRLHLTAAGTEYSATAIDPEKGETSAYGFGDPDGSDDGTTYPFILRYYKDGYSYTDEDSGDTVKYGECFVLEFNKSLSSCYVFDEEAGETKKGVSLTYDVVLTNPQTASGTYGEYDQYGDNNDGSAGYGLYTNNQADFYPKDKDGNPYPRQTFKKPTVSYTVEGGDNPKSGNPNPDRPDTGNPTPTSHPNGNNPNSGGDNPNSGTGSSGSGDNGTGSAKTGDTTPLLALLVVALVAAGVGTTAGVRMYRNNHKNGLRR